MAILQRAVLSDLLKVFSGVATALTLLLVVVGVIGEASKSGLGPMEILQILPYIVPSLLPFTIPATFLLTVCVVYGRMSGDQEVTAMKAAGINVVAILWPAFILGAVLSLGTLLLTDLFVPWARGRIEHIVTTSMENIFLDMLRAHNKFSDPIRGIAITVRRVDDHKLIDPTFRYTLPSGQTTLIACREATLQFDLTEKQVLLDLYDGHVETPGGTALRFPDHIQRPFPLPLQSTGPAPPRNIPIQNIRRELGMLIVDSERLQQKRILSAAFSLTTGGYDDLLPSKQNPLDRKQDEQKERRQKLTTELHSRVALACSCFFFGLVGSPFAILQGKRQFLTSFALCFVPILLVYYPSVLLSMNLSREGIVHPAWAMWVGNAGLSLAGWIILQKVLRH